MESTKPIKRTLPSLRTVIVLAVGLLAVLLVCAPFLFAIAFADEQTKAATVAANASPIFGVTIPSGYRRWELVGPAEEAAPLDELRAVLGNEIAIEAYRNGKLPFPDGSVLVKLAWKRAQSPEFASATIPGSATTVQVMVKDARKYAATGGWGFGRFVNGHPADEAQHRTCFACHEAGVKDRDFVFTRFAP